MAEQHHPSAVEDEIQEPPPRAARPRRRRRRGWIAAVVVVVVVAAAAGTWFYLHRSSAATTDGATTQLVAASTETVKETVASTGTIEPANQANLKFGQSGKITAVGVKVGDTVTAGQTLATIDATSLQAAVTLAEQQLTAAQAQLTAATTAANSSQIASANAQVTSAQSKLTAAQEALAQATLTSSIDGTVAAVNVAVGDSVSAGSSTSGSSTGASGGSSTGGAGSTGSTGSSGAGSTAASSASSAQVVVIATNSWIVNATVGASDLAKLKAGLQATITPSGATQAIFGTVSTVGVIGTTSGGTSTFPVTIAVTGSPTGVYAGTTAAVVVTTKQVPDVLTVPTSAIHDENGQTVVYQMKDGQQVSTAVTVGTVYGTTTQITKGLSAGDQVVVSTRFARASTGSATGGTGTNRSGTGGLNGNLGGSGFGSGGSGGGQAPQPPAGGPGGN